MKMVSPFSFFMPDRREVIGGSNGNGSAIFIFYSRPHCGHGSEENDSGLFILYGLFFYPTFSILSF